MKARRSAMYFSYSSLGVLALMGALPLQAFGDDDRTQAATAQHHQPGSDQKKPARCRDISVAEAEDYELHFGCVSGPDVGGHGPALR